LCVKASHRRRNPISSLTLCGAWAKRGPRFPHPGFQSSGTHATSVGTGDCASRAFQSVRVGSPMEGSLVNHRRCAARCACSGRGRITRGNRPLSMEEVT
jgi:hypothetical protein